MKPHWRVSKNLSFSQMWGSLQSGDFSSAINRSSEITQASIYTTPAVWLCRNKLNAIVDFAPSWRSAPRHGPLRDPLSFCNETIRDFYWAKDRSEVIDSGVKSIFSATKFGADEFGSIKRDLLKKGESVDRIHYASDDRYGAFARLYSGASLEGKKHLLEAAREYFTQYRDLHGQKEAFKKNYEKKAMERQKEKPWHRRIQPHPQSYYYKGGGENDPKVIRAL